MPFGNESQEREGQDSFDKSVVDRPVVKPTDHSCVFNLEQGSCPRVNFNCDADPRVMPMMRASSGLRA